MLEERRLRGGRPVVGPARAEHRAQPRIVHAREFLGERAVGPVLHLRAVPLAQRPAHRRGRRMLREQGRCDEARGRAGLEPTVNRRLLLRKARQQCVAVRALGVGDAELEPRQPHDVVRIRAGTEAQRVVREPREQPAEPAARAGLRRHATDVVHARRKAPLAAAERLRQPAWHGVLLQHQHPAALASERGGRRQPAYARSDHDGVPHARPPSASRPWRTIGGRARESLDVAQVAHAIRRGEGCDLLAPGQARPRRVA